MQFPLTLSSAAPGQQQAAACREEQTDGMSDSWDAGWGNTLGQRFGAAHSSPSTHTTLSRTASAEGQLISATPVTEASEPFKES